MTDLMQLVLRKLKKQPPHTHVFWQEICFSYNQITKSGMKIDIIT